MKTQLINLKVQTPTEIHSFTVPINMSVRDALDATDLRVRAACGGTGSCGACLVRLVAGEVNGLTTAEYMKLPLDERQHGMRLACQLRLQGDTEIHIDDPAPPSQWKSIPPEALIEAPPGQPSLADHIYGVAVDLGTTTIRVTLWDRKNGHRIASRRGPNPQSVFGADVLNRIDAANASPGRTAELAKLARSAIVQALRDILKRDVGEVNSMLAEIGQVCIVANSAMLALLTEHGAAELLDPDHWSSRGDCRPRDPESWAAQWFMPNALFLLPETVGGFVGSDLVADLVATRLTEGPVASLLLDVGTNTEIALWDGERLHVTSVPGGPAFEGVGIRNGMAAEPGAIQAVRAAGDGFILDTIAGDEPRGFCGSGLLDAVALLLDSGRLKPSGRFSESPGVEGLPLDPANPRTAITGSDVDAFQRAKAATAAALAVLLQQAHLEWPQIRRLCVCGAFGRTLNIANAQAVGLLPPVDPALVELNADTSLAGCEMGLLYADGMQRFESMINRIDLINLSRILVYDDIYIDQLRLRPIEPKSSTLGE